MRRTSYRTTETTDAPVVHEDLQDDATYDAADVVERRSEATAFESLPSRVNAVVFTVLFALEALLALRFTLIAFGANRDSGFVDFILDVSWPFVRPFDGAFANRTWDEGIIEVSTLLAMGVWALGFLLLVMFISAVLPKVYGERDVVTRRRATHIQ